MKKNKKRVFAAFLSVVMSALLLTGCGNDENKDKRAVDLEYVYVPEYLSLSKDALDSIDAYNIINDKLYYVLSTYDDTSHEELGKSLYVIDLTKEKPTSELQMELNKGTSSDEYDYYGRSYVMTQKGEVVYCLNGYSNSIDNENGKNLCYLCKTDKDGNEIFRIDMWEYLNQAQEDAYLQYIVVDKAGNIYASNGSTYVWSFDTEGNALKTIKLESSGDYSYINSFGCLKDGRIAYLSNDRDGMVVHAYDETKKDFSTTYDNLPRDCYNSSITPGIEGDICLTSGSTLYDYHIETKTSDEVLKWLDVDINGDYVNGVNILSNGNVVIMYRDWNTDESSIIILKKTPASEVVVKEQITLGCMSLSQNLQESIVNFNKNNSQYRISIKNYTDGIDWTKQDAMNDYDAAMIQLKSDIISGNVCDLFAASDVDMKMLASKGVIEDLTPYLEKSEVIHKEDFIQSVLNAVTINGKICTIPKNFSVNTIVGRTAELGEKSGWTMADMIAYVNQYPDAKIFSYATNKTVVDYCLMFDIDSYINWETGECHFNTDEFKSILELAKLYPDEDTQTEYVSEPKALRTHEALLSIGSFSTPEDWQVTSKMFDEPITAIGYPSTSGTGVVAYINDGVCINAGSKKKDAAWSFIESLFKDNGSSDQYQFGFDIRKSVYDEKMKEAMTPNYQTDENGNNVLDENGNPIEVSNGGYGWGDDISVEVYSVKQEEADALWNVIMQINGTMNYQSEFINIVNEEIEPYFKNQKSVDEVMDIIQSRIQVYVNESR